jgi:histidyl-tRNA synthetase
MELVNRIPIGTNDVIGKDARVRDYIIQNVKNTYERYGFEPLYTPSIENAEVFNGHHGEGEKLLFNFKDKNNQDLVLKYDSTVPLARVVSMHPEIARPYKRYQLQSSFRDDTVDKGHFREFVQLDGDIVGADSLAADAEFAMIAHDVLKSIGFDDFKIRLNHRKLIKGIAEQSDIYDKKGLLEVQRAIDYADKITKNGLTGIRADLERRNVTPKVVDKIVELVSVVSNDSFKSLDNIEQVMKKSTVAREGIDELREILGCIPSKMHNKVGIDFTLARGADYYTGAILEGVINNIKLGAVLGGGRYDDLVSKFSGEKVSAVGMAFGLERLMIGMRETYIDQKQGIIPPSVVLNYPQSMQKEVMKIANALRENFNVSLNYNETNEEKAQNYVKVINGSVGISFVNPQNASVTDIGNNVEYFTAVHKKLGSLGVNTDIEVVK